MVLSKVLWRLFKTFWGITRNLKIKFSRIVCDCNGNGWIHWFVENTKLKMFWIYLRRSQHFANQITRGWEGEVQGKYFHLSGSSNDLRNKASKWSCLDIFHAYFIKVSLNFFGKRLILYTGLDLKEVKENLRHILCHKLRKLVFRIFIIAFDKFFELLL